MDPAASPNGGSRGEARRIRRLCVTLNMEIQGLKEEPEATGTVPFIGPDVLPPYSGGRWSREETWHPR